MHFAVPENRAKRAAAIKSVSTRKREACRKLLYKLKSAPCTDCKQTFDPVCMQFDHLPGTNKIADVTYFKRRAHVKAMLAEIAKCELVCANCHCLRGKARRGD